MTLNKTNFLALGVSAQFNELLKKNGIIEPTPIQEKAIPEAIAGNDIIGQAQTGTGKTLAFLLPIFDRMNTDSESIQALVITPTRELAIQITGEARKLTAAKSVNILAAYGGQDVSSQIRKLKGAVHLVIGTPGRLLDHIRRKTIDLAKLKILVLDEADQMLDMGFMQDVEQILRHANKNRQTMLFSATLQKGITMLTAKYMNNPVQIRVHGKNITLDEIKQIAINTTDRGKQGALCKLLDEYRPYMAIIFCRTKRRASELNKALQALNYCSEELHGDLTQAKREKVMKAFRKSEIHYLVATDVAARGLDIEGITHIFNYDIPADAESYIHRIGRTGRAKQTGVAITFVSPRDKEMMNTIEREIKSKIERKNVLGAEGNAEPTDIKAHGRRGYNKFGRASNAKGKKTANENKTRGKSPYQGKSSSKRTSTKTAGAASGRGRVKGKAPARGYKRP